MKRLAVIAMVFLFAMSPFGALAEGESQVVRQVHYLTAKAMSEDRLVVIDEIGKKYLAEGGNVELVIETSADRSTYEQKLRTMIAGNQMPDMFDIDATPYCAELANADLLVNIEDLLKELGIYDEYIPLSLAYQELPDGRVFMIPFEYASEMTWYNVDIFNQYGLKPPKTFEEWFEICEVLAQNGVTPIALDGIDGWPLMRYIAPIPFRKSGNDFLMNLSTGAAKMSDPLGVEAAEFVARIGQYFQTGFSATDYATAHNLFFDGKAAMYEVGTWDLDKFLADKIPEGLNVDYFYMPMCEGAVTKANEYWAFGGIGTALNKASFDEDMRDFIVYLLKEYDAGFLAKQHLPARRLKDDVDFSNFDPLFLRIQQDMSQMGETAAKPWDTALPEDTVSTLGDSLVAIALGEISVEEFVQIMDESLEQNVAQ